MEWLVVFLITLMFLPFFLSLNSGYLPLTPKRKAAMIVCCVLAAILPFTLAAVIYFQ